MNEIARKLDFSLRRLVSALIIIYFFAAPFASTYASGAVTEVFQEGKKAATRKLTGKIIDKNTKETLIGASTFCMYDFEVMIYSVDCVRKIVY